MDGLYIFLIWLLFIGTIVVITLVVTPTQDKKRLQELMAFRGAREVYVRQRWFGGGKNHRAYEVTFWDSSGVYQDTDCLITGAFWGEPSVYWLDTLGAQYTLGERGQPQFSDSTRVSVLEADNAALSTSAKDQLIRRLLDENKQLRLELRNRRNSI